MDKINNYAAVVAFIAVHVAAAAAFASAFASADCYQTSVIVAETASAVALVSIVSMLLTECYK